MKEIKLPEDFLMGTATSGLQIEGCDTNNNWYKWCEEGHIQDGSNCVNAADHWNRYEEDINIMEELNHDIYRMGLEWSRIEPEKGHFSSSGLEHYRKEIEGLLEKGIKPLVTLHHFSHPLWLVEEGGWENPQMVDYFKRYTEHVVNNLGDLVSEWITINEPNVFLFNGYLEGIWPPGKTSMSGFLKALRNMIKAHIESYRSIHGVRKKSGYHGVTKVGVANHLRVFQPERDRLLDRVPASLMSYMFQDLVMDAMTSGKMKFPLGVGHYPLGRGKFYDFIGINYYTRDIIQFEINPAMMFGQLKVKEDSQVNDLGWEIYPEGIYRLSKKYHQRYKAPIYITENGICDNEDDQRSRFIYNHLQQISRAIDEGIPIERYYHWSLLDNFEWLEGESARFGLVHINYQTQERTIKESGLFYGEICKKKAVTTDMINRYIRG